MQKCLCLIFFLQDQCLPAAAGALAEQVGSFDLFGLFVSLFCWLVGWFVQFVVWWSRLDSLIWSFFVDERYT